MNIYVVMLNYEHESGHAHLAFVDKNKADSKALELNNKPLSSGEFYTVAECELVQ